MIKYIYGGLLNVLVVFHRFVLYFVWFVSHMLHAWLARAIHVESRRRPFRLLPDERWICGEPRMPCEITNLQSKKSPPVPQKWRLPVPRWLDEKEIRQFRLSQGLRHEKQVSLTQRLQMTLPIRMCLSSRSPWLWQRPHFNPETSTL